VRSKWSDIKIQGKKWISKRGEKKIEKKKNLLIGLPSQMTLTAATPNFNAIAG
jgi:hypothetical protein